MSKAMKASNKKNYSSIESICSSLGVRVNSPGWPDAFGQRMKKYLDESGVKRIKTLSLFSGAGGLDIGFSDMGFDIVASVEIEEQFCKTLIRNTGKGQYFDNSIVNCIDIRDYTSEGLKDIEWIIGGPPCQTFSAAGRRVAGVLGTNDARGTLFKEYVRILKEVQPRGFLFENVFGIVGAQNGEPWREIIQSFKDAGYNLFYRILDAADYGTPQHRERLVIIGLKDGSFSFPRPTHGPDSRDHIPFYNALSAISNVQSSEDLSKCEIKGRYRELLKEIPPGLNYSYFTEKMGHPRPVFAWRSKFSDFMYKADPNEPVRTITATGRQYTGPLHWDNRYFTCEEYKRLQTFPDCYTVLGVKPVVIQQIGNSVPPQLARILAMSIRTQVFGTQLPYNLETIDDSFEMTYKYRKRELSKKYREAAMQQIKQLSCSDFVISKKSRYWLSISDKFEYLMSDKAGKYNVTSSWNKDALRIVVKENGNQVIHPAKITIRPQKAWVLPVKKVELIAEAADWGGLCAAWRVLDHEIIENNLKADIIQLNGYYLYESELRCDLSQEGLDYPIILDSLTKGECTQRIVTDQELCKMWRISADELPLIAQYIKDFGFDIRNSNTNPQMGKNEWIIPYKFPSLVSQSVQLYKKL